MSLNDSLYIGEIVDNTRIVNVFKCSTQGGMRRSLETNTLVLISDHTKSIYDDQWVSKDILHFTGIGLEGDQQIAQAPNKTLANAEVNKVSLFLCEAYARGRYLFRGRGKLFDEPYEAKQPDRNNQLRNVWIFPIIIVYEGAGYQVPDALIEKKRGLKKILAKTLTDKALFFRAVHSNNRPVSRQTASATFEPNVYVSELAHRRSGGFCQLCHEPAPFTDNKDAPYLESHHIHRLSGGGEDTVENTVALCPNCHRKMHVLNLKVDVNKLKEEAQKNCCQLTIDGKIIYV